MELAEEDLKRRFKDDNYDDDINPENEAYSTYDYIDDKLLDKLYYTTNAQQPYFGSSNAFHGLVGFSFALSGHYLYKQLIKWSQDTLPYYIGDNHEDDIIDIADVRNEDDNTTTLLDKIRSYRRSACNVYHTLILASTSTMIFSIMSLYIEQIRHKEKDTSGYGYLAAGTGIFGVDLGSVTSLISGIVMYPFVINVKQIWSWHKKIQSHKQKNLNNNQNK